MGGAHHSSEEERKQVKDVKDASKQLEMVFHMELTAQIVTMRVLHFKRMCIKEMCS